MTRNKSFFLLALLVVVLLSLAGCTGANGIAYPHLITPVPPIPTVRPRVEPPTATPFEVSPLMPTVTPEPTPTPDCNIKGNINSKGERIYYVPGQLNYSRTVIDTSKGEKFFCSEAEAKDAGFRKAFK
jgi:hypothetical protein